MSATFSNKKVIVLIVVAAVLVVGAGAFALMRALNPGSRVVEQAFAKLAAAPSLHTSAELSINLPERFGSRNRPLTKVDIAIVGDVARHDGAPEMAGTLDIEARGRGNAFFTNGDLRIFRDRMAFRLTEFPTLLNPSGSLSEKWTYVTVPLLQTNNGEALRVAAAALAT